MDLINTNVEPTHRTGIWQTRGGTKKGGKVNRSSIIFYSIPGYHRMSPMIVEFHRLTSMCSKSYRVHVVGSFCHIFKCIFEMVGQAPASHLLLVRFFNRLIQGKHVENYDPLYNLSLSWHVRNIPFNQFWERLGKNCGAD